MDHRWKDNRQRKRSTFRQTCPLPLRLPRLLGRLPWDEQSATTNSSELRPNPSFAVLCIYIIEHTRQSVGACEVSQGAGRRPARSCVTPWSPQSRCNLSTLSATDFQVVNVGASGSLSHTITLHIHRYNNYD
jgi:hypothetical protein